MTTREDRGERIGRTRFFTYRRFVSRCAKCPGVVFIDSIPSKQETQARAAYDADLTRQMARATKGLTAAWKKHRAEMRKARPLMVSVLGGK